MGIPNLWPFTRALLKQVVRLRERAKVNKSLAKEKKTKDLRTQRAHQEAGVGGLPGPFKSWLSMQEVVRRIMPPRVAMRQGRPTAGYDQRRQI